MTSTETITSTGSTLSKQPADRRCPFNPPAELTKVAAERPVSRFRFPDGVDGWLVTDYALVRAALADNRLSAGGAKRKSPVRRPIPTKDGESSPITQPGMFLAMDPPDHTRFRRLLTGQFTLRRMRLLEPRVEHIVDDHLDRIEAAGPPAELVSSFALPIPSLVICELLGVPYSDRESFQHASSVVLSLTVTPDEVRDAWRSIHDFLRDLIQLRRRERADDLISGLLESDLTEEELIGVSQLLLIAGHETTANMLGLGTFALLENPAQLARIRAGEVSWDTAVEELLRYLTIIQFGTARFALEDLEIGGFPIAAGDSVALSLPAGNWDPARYPDGDQLDVGRSATGHLTFGHGIHQCLGQQLARIEMRIGYAKLFDRFPHLALAVPAAEVPVRSDMAVYGVHQLPITW